MFNGTNESRWNISIDVEYILIIIASKFTSVKLNGMRRKRREKKLDMNEEEEER